MGRTPIKMTLQQRKGAKKVQFQFLRLPQPISARFGSIFMEKASSKRCRFLKIEIFSFLTTYIPSIRNKNLT